MLWWSLGLSMTFLFKSASTYCGLDLIFLKMRQKVKFNKEKSFLDQTKIILTRPKRPVDNQMTANEGQMTAN